MATTKKLAPATRKKEVQPVKPSVTPKPQVVLSTVPPAAKAAVKKVPVAKGGTVKPAPQTDAVVKARTTQKKATTAARTPPIDPVQRANYIEVAAFYIAERRGFAPGNPEQDYLDAAAEIDRLIAAGHFGN